MFVHNLDDWQLTSFYLHCTLEIIQAWHHVLWVWPTFQIPKNTPANMKMGTKMEGSLPILCPVRCNIRWMFFSSFKWTDWCTSRKPRVTWCSSFSDFTPSASLVPLIIDVSWEKTGMQVSHLYLEVNHFVLYSKVIMFLFSLQEAHKMMNNRRNGSTLQRKGQFWMFLRCNLKN